MWKRKRALIVAACLALVGALALLALRARRSPPEPAYGGHPLSYWVASLSWHSDASEAEERNATNAIDHIGVAALPYLVRWIQYEPGRWRAKVGTFLEKSPVPFTHGLGDKIAFPKAERLATGTYDAFQVLGTRATPALDELCRLMNATNAPVTSSRATENLACLGTNALPALLAVIRNQSHPNRARAVEAVGTMGVFGDLGDAAKVAVPAIVAYLQETNEQTSGMVAIGALGRLKAVPELSVPALASCLNRTNEYFVPSWAAEALGEFGPQAASAIPALTNALADPNRRRLCESVAEALHKIAPDTFTNVPPPRHID